MKNSPFLVFILPTLGLLAIGMVITSNFATTPPASLHSSLQRDGLTQRAVLAEKELSASAEREDGAALESKGPEGPRLFETRPPVVIHQAVKSTAPDYDRLITPFIEEIKAGAFVEAEKTLAKIERKIPASIHSALQFSLDSARETRRIKATVNAEREQRRLALAMVEAEKERRVRSVAEAREETEKVDKARIEVEQHLVKMQAESADLINTSIEELNQAAEVARAAAERAEKSVQETARLITSNAKVETNPKALPKTEIQNVADKPTAQATPPAPPKIKSITLPETESIQFGNNSSAVSAESNAIIEQAAKQLKEEPGISLELRGFTDSRGDPVYNAALSRTRSENVKKALVERGAPSERIKVLPFGATKSLEGNSDNQRRVDLVFVLWKEQLTNSN